MGGAGKGLLQLHSFFKGKALGMGCCHCKEQLDSDRNGAIKVNVISNGNRTEWGPIRFVVIRVIDKIGRPRSGSPICLITSMITNRIGRHEVLLPINHNFNKIFPFSRESRIQYFFSNPFFSFQNT